MTISIALPPDQVRLDAIALRLANLGTDSKTISWVIYGTDANANAVAERVKRMRRERAAQ